MILNRGRTDLELQADPYGNISELSHPDSFWKIPQVWRSNASKKHCDSTALGRDSDIKRIVLQEPTSIDDIISKELLQLSLKDRTANDEEVHGVSSLYPEETPQLLEAALRKMSVELARIPDNFPAKAAYLMSQALPVTYVNGADFRLRFLRVEIFNAKNAAMRMVKFLDFASDLFGPEVLERPMRITDFSKEEEKLLRAGNIQIFPYRDRSGRAIFTRVGDWGFQQGTVRSRNKVSLYMQYSMSDDIETQRRGVTKVYWAVSNFSAWAFPKWENFEYNKRLAEALPIRTISEHWGVPDTTYFHVIRSGHVLTSEYIRKRQKFHFGNEVELLYSLKTYGIPAELIPVTGTGNVKTAYLRQWMRYRKTVEEMRAKGYSDASFIVCPRLTDVVFRGGTSLTCHPGNSMLESMIEAKTKDHSDASQTEKMTITKEIIDMVVQREGRFLKWDTRGWWTELKGTQVHNKVAVCVKGFKDKSVAQRNRQNSRCSTDLFQNQDGKRRKISRDDTDNKCAGCCLP